MTVWKQWRDTPYEVSDTGQVRSMHRRRRRKATVVNNAGYVLVHLSIGNRSIMVPVHRMVAEAHLPNPQGLEEIDHIDHDKANNSVSNLRWVTRQVNALNRPQAEDHPPIKCYDEAGVWVRDYPTFLAAAKAVGITSGQGIKAVCEGTQRTCGGHVFRYYDGIPEQLYLF